MGADGTHGSLLSRFADLFSMKEETEGIAYDSGSSSVIKLNNGMVLYLREVNKYAGQKGLGSARRRERGWGNDRRCKEVAESRPPLSLMVLL